MTSVRFASVLLGLGLAFAASAEEIELGMFGKVTVVDEIDCTKTDHRFREYPEGKSRVETILGRECRTMPVMPEEASFLAWRVGEGKGLKANGSYVIVLEYPEDVARNYIIHNRATGSKRSFSTGACTGDCWNPKYVDNHMESFLFPLSGQWEKWTCFTTLQDWSADLNDSRKVVWESEGVPKRNDNGDIVVETTKLLPEDGFEFSVVQYGRLHDPVTAGLAVSRILLCEIPDEAALYAKIQYPADGLPRRHIFWREEMSDGGPLADYNPQCADRMSWFRHKARQMRMLGMNTFCKDLLEFGHVQHWDPDYIRGGWAWHAATRWLWVPLVEYMAKEGFYILPYYEWCGNIGWEGANPPPLGPQKRAIPLNRTDNNYTQIAWTEKADIDITDPEALKTTKELLDGTILRFKDQLGSFVGAFFRTRPANWPVGFSEDSIARFRRELYGQSADDELFGGGQDMAVSSKMKRPSFSDDLDELDMGGDAAPAPVSQTAEFGRKINREVIRKDGEMYRLYLRWWHMKRAQFLQDLRDYLVEKGMPDAQIIFDSDTTEPGPGCENVGILTDDPDGWVERLTQPPFNRPAEKIICSSVADTVKSHGYLKERRKPLPTYKDFEWQHACPGDDPENYNNKTNVFLAMAINRMYSVADPEAFKAYRNHEGVNTIIRHYPLNENMVYRYDPVSGEEARLVGYAIHDTERAGRACMQTEVAAMASGNPVNLGYLMGSTFARGFPEPVREFNLNFLALPALSSKLVQRGPIPANVTLREIDAEKKVKGSGTYFALTYQGFRPAENVKVRFPAGVKSVKEIVSGTVHSVDAEGFAVFSFQPWQLIALHAE